MEAPCPSDAGARQRDGGACGPPLAYHPAGPFSSRPDRPVDASLSTSHCDSPAHATAWFKACDCVGHLPSDNWEIDDELDATATRPRTYGFATRAGRVSPAWHLSNRRGPGEP